MTAGIYEFQSFKVHDVDAGSNAKGGKVRRMGIAEVDYKFYNPLLF